MVILSLLGAAGCQNVDQPAVQVADTSVSSSLPTPLLLNLSNLEAYDLQVLAIGGKPVATERARVSSIEAWSLNTLGQVLFFTMKDSNRGYAADLFLIEGEKRSCLLMVREGQPFTSMRVPSIETMLLGHRGEIYVQGKLREDRLEMIWRLMDGGAVPVPQSDREIRNVLLSRDGRLAFLAFDRQRGLQKIFAGDGEKLVEVAHAAGDPSDPLAQFAGFDRLWGINSRGQILFDGHIGRGFSGDRLFLYSPPETDNGKEIAPASVRQIARHGARLPGTTVTLRDKNGHDVWRAPQLSERGDVAMIAELDRAADTSDEREALLVLPAQGEAWQVRVSHGAPVGSLPLIATRLSPPGIDSAGTLACIVQVDDPDDRHGQNDVLVRFTPQGSAVELTRAGNVLPSGETILGLCGGWFPCPAPLVLGGGEVVCQATIGGEESSQFAVLIANEQLTRVAARFSSELPFEPDFQFSSIDEVQANDAGQLGILLSDGSRRPMLLLASPRYRASGPANANESAKDRREPAP